MIIYLQNRDQHSMINSLEDQNLILMTLLLLKNFIELPGIMRDHDGNPVETYNINSD